MQFALLLVVWVQTELAAEFTEISMRVDTVLAVRADEPFLVDVAKRRRAGRLGLVDVERGGIRQRLLHLMVDALWHELWCSCPVGRRDARLVLLATDNAVIWFGAEIQIKLQNYYIGKFPAYFCLWVFSVRGKRLNSAVLAELLEEELKLAVGLLLWPPSLRPVCWRAIEAAPSASSSSSSFWPLPECMFLK